MGQSARALADLERIATLQPQDNGARTAVAAQLLRMGRVEQAYAQVDLVAQSIGYPNAKVQMFIGMAQSLASSLKASDPAKAEAALTNALSVEADFPALLIDRAGIREMRGDSRGAAADIARFQQLTRIDLDDPAQACVSQALFRHSRDVALTMCDKAIERKGNDAALHMRRGYLLYVLNRKSEAVAAYRTATELDPSNQQAKYGLGKALKDSGQAAEGDALMAAALSSDPRANEGYDTPLLEVRVSD